jgi:CRISPR-associated protein Csh1
MIKEIVQFTEKLTSDIRQRGIKPKDGLHILLKLTEKEDIFSIDLDNTQHIRYTKKMEENLASQENELVEKLKMLQQNAWMVDSAKGLDNPEKGIHSASPFLMAFKSDFFEGGGKNVASQAKKNKNREGIPARFQRYFSKAFDLFEENERESLSQKYTVFKNFFLQEDSPVYYKTILDRIVKESEQKTEELESEIKELKEQEKSADKSEKETFTTKIKHLTEKLEHYKPLTETDYILFYLDEELETYQKPYNRYLADRLFNTPLFTTAPNEDNELFGTSNFRNGFNSSMPFLLHQTATFDISGRISDWEALKLNEFQSILPRKVLPNPLPMFVFENETLNEKVISYFNENDGKVGYKEIITNLINSKNKDKVGNYYLLFYQNTKDGLVFQDFDFVPKFDYELKDEVNDREYWKVEDLFDINFSTEVRNVFDFQDRIVREMFSNALITGSSKSEKLIYKYFDDIDSNYCKSAKIYLLAMSYRKAFYDFIYKSQRQAITKNMFDDIMQTSILEHIRLDEGEIKNGQLRNKEYFNIRKKLNIWFSLSENFVLSDSNSNPNPTTTMANQLPKYREFVRQLAEKNADVENTEASIEEFAFAAGQVIYYIFKKSKSQDTSYQRLEPYLQKTNFDEFQKVICNEFARYKHENYSRKFQQVSSFVLSYSTDANVKEYLPQILAGIFSDNLLYGDKEEIKTEVENKEGD